MADDTRSFRETVEENRSARDANQPVGRLRSSLTAKFAGLFGCVIGAIALLVYFYVPSQFEEQARSGLEERGESLARMAAFSLQAAVLFEDQAAMEETLRGLAVSGEVLYAAVVASNGETIAETGQLGTDIASLPPPEATPLLTSGSGLLLGRPIRVRGETHGHVWLALSTAPLEARVAEARRTITLTSLVIFIFGLSAILGITATLTRSLSGILRAADGIASGDLTQRVEVRSSDEAGQLAETFNRMASELQASETRLRAAMGRIEGILEHIPIAVSLFDLEGRLLYVNPHAVEEPQWRARAIGLTMEEYYRQRGYPVPEGFSHQDQIARSIEGKTEPREDLLELPGGDIRHVLRGFSPVRADDGTVQQVVGFGIDVTDRVEAQNALLDSEARLIQAQKMESIGQLAGGVAHDFNNLLTVIIGRCELMLFELGVDDQHREHVLEIELSAARAGELTKQLLAFGRKQVLQPRPLVLNEVVRGTKAMLSRLIDDAIVLETVLDPASGSVMADEAQIQQVLVNLVLNACDAMPRGGTIRIETASIKHDRQAIGGISELETGDYVRLSVSDEGIGMDEATLGRIFEPFFTTKGPNEGTGLGLSTAYGIVRQSGGIIAVESKVDAGSTFHVYLPHTVASGSSPVEAAVVDKHGGSETVLLVEDQLQVRKAIEQILLRQGYRILVAGGPMEALQIVRTGEDIDLLLTDVMMPEMSGQALAEEVTKVLPEIGTLFMSGFTGDALNSRGVLEPGVTLIEKPFAAVDLYDAVRSVLDQPKSSSV